MKYQISMPSADINEADIQAVVDISHSESHFWTI
jgi:hypothetical protein